MSLLLVVTILACAFDQATCLKFSYPTFKEADENHFIKEKSYIVLNALQVTADVNGAPISDLSGRILYKDPFKLWKKKGVTASFNSTFVLKITPRTVPGGEGLAFLITGKTGLPDNSDGRWLGIVNSSTDGLSQNQVVAIEFDSRKSHAEDGDDNHVGLDVNSIFSIKQEPLANYGVNLSAAINITARVEYDGKNISLFVSPSNETGDHMKNPVISYTIDLSEYLPQDVYLGFSASTSNYTELNCIRSWFFEGSKLHEDPKLLWVWISVPTVLVLCALIYLLYRIRTGKKGLVEDNYPTIEDQIKGSSTAPRKFWFKDLKKATSNFKNKLGQGGFGTVYKGRIMDKEVAVKRVSQDSRQGKQEFLAEITTIGSLHHRNLVKLIGWCYERRELLLVYEYMPNSSLDKYIYCHEKLIASGPTLNWQRRYNIISGVAKALDYLHNGCEKRVLHRDIKASNIMLDLEFNARLGDFGLARTIQRTEQTHHSTKEIAGTWGYMAPESFLTGRATVETDIYAFGVLMLEVFCGRKPGDQNEETSIVSWVWELHRRGRILSAADSRMSGEFGDREMEDVLVLGLACCHPNPYCRPSMRIVLQVMTGEVAPPIVPLERPAFIWPSMPPSFREDLDCSNAEDQITLITELCGR
ncbi:hypothetical protein NL676_001750 [Syzygium grande]|nr:hypothetical protein NL676_001750 [Syzygium grande]